MYKMLEEHRIGNLAKADREAAANAPVHQPPILFSGQYPSLVLTATRASHGPRSERVPTLTIPNGSRF